MVLSRRAVLTSAAALLTKSLVTGRPALGQEQNPDRGIGGTGVAPSEGQAGGDRGIGGTGVIGTIRRFGSIYVNDLHITFPRTVTVLIDDQTARLKDLRLGHVVGVLAERRGGRLSTRLISVTSEVVGPVEAVNWDQMVVLGQRVVLHGAAAARGLGRSGLAWRVGDFVGVSGLRRLDGTIVASLVERRRPGPLRLTGPAVAERDGSVTIGHLPVAGLRAALIGTRVALTGHLAGGMFHVQKATRPLDRLLALQPSQVSIEAYVALQQNGMLLGSGLAVQGNASSAPTSVDAKAVVTAAVRPDGALRLQSLRFESDRQGSRAGGPGTASSGPAGPPGSFNGPGAPAAPGFGGPNTPGFGGPNAPGFGFGMPGDPAGAVGAGPPGDPGFGLGRFGGQTGSGPLGLGSGPRSPGPVGRGLGRVGR